MTRSPQLFCCFANLIQPQVSPAHFGARSAERRLLEDSLWKADHGKETSRIFHQVRRASKLDNASVKTGKSPERLVTYCL